MSIGSYLASRLSELGIGHYFAVPGDYNLILLDEFLKNRDLQLIGCSNELNAGYAADGYARANGIAATVVTYSVGALSQINAIAGAYAESLPIVCISGGPNTNSIALKHLLHHSLGEANYTYVRDMFEKVTAAAVVIDNPKTALKKIDEALCVCVLRRKPVYIEIACNLSARECETRKDSLCRPDERMNAKTFRSAVARAAELLNSAQRPALVAGIKLRSYGCIDLFADLQKQCRIPTAVMPNAKGLVDETSASFMGVYWGQMSSPGVLEYVSASDCVLFAGPAFTDYTTCGYTIPTIANNTIVADPRTVSIAGSPFYDVPLPLFLSELAKAMQPMKIAMPKRAHNQKRKLLPNAKRFITLKRLYETVRAELLDGQSTIVAETGDSWFECLKVPLPSGCRFEIQMQYGSIGWSVGATLGYAIASGKKRRVVTFVGDGSFQMSAQEVSTIIRYGASPIIFLINNRGYQIEERIHGGPYNEIQNWKYAELASVFKGGTGAAWSASVRTEGELLRAIKKAARSKALSFVEVHVDPKDNAEELITFGKLASEYNKAPYRELAPSRAFGFLNL
ncbi:pyruvate decarboxylase [Candidatus Uhrbacteria bacterium]|nr:pyruvate decarboxylase [Candidatus Uhrbacteria bacterium]